MENEKGITNTAELGSLSNMALDNHIANTIKQIADGIKASGLVEVNEVHVQFDLIVAGQPCSFFVPVKVK